MFKQKTVFILGAGASADFDLPLGPDLLKKIVQLLDFEFDAFSEVSRGDKLVFNALQHYTNDISELNQYIQAARQIVQSAPQAISIDNLVYALEDEKAAFVAKLAIVRAIQIAESSSSYFRSTRDRHDKLLFSSFGDTWYENLTRLLCEDLRKSEIPKVFENVSFVSFNYDRCIERYLAVSVANYFGASASDVVNEFEKISIHRPYGVAGEMYWHGGTIPVGFGETRDPTSLVKAANQIRTFTEGMNNVEQIDAMHLDLANAKKIVFLGSAFHPQNLKLLATKVRHDVTLFATVSGISAPNMEIVKKDLKRTFDLHWYAEGGGYLHFADMYAKPFFETYSRSLTA